MGATFSRIKTWNPGDNLTASDINAEFNNILNNLDPTGVDDASESEGYMQATADPYPGGAVSLATDLAGELHRLRHVLKKHGGGSYWYTDGVVLYSDSYADINTAISNIGSSSVNLIVRSAETLTGSLTVPSNVNLVILKGGSIVKDSTYTLTINGPFEAGLYQVFSGFSSGNVTFGSGSVKEVYPEWWGAVADSSTNCTTAINSAVQAGATDVYLKVVLSAGTYLFASTITIDDYVEVKGAGIARTILLKKSTLSGNGITMTGEFPKLSDIQVKGQTGNGGDGVVVTAHRAILDHVSVDRMGNDGIRLGADVDVDTNSWILDNCSSYINGRHGLYIHSGSPVDVNAGLATNFIASGNAEDGIKLDGAIWNTFIGTLSEGNTGYGINISPSSALSGYNFFIGGDSEANTAGQVYISSNAQSNQIWLTSPAVPISDNSPANAASYILNSQSTTYSPTVTGETGAGTCTYTTQNGQYKRIGNMMWVTVNVTWTGHTGTGNLMVSLPRASGSSNFNNFGACGASNIVYTANASLAAYVGASSSVARIYVSTSNAAGTNMQVEAAGSLFFTIMYEL